MGRRGEFLVLMCTIQLRLTLYRRNDWAAAGRDAVRSTEGTEEPPLLIAARASRIESVEWFLSDAPLRHYLAFAKSKATRNDARLKHLAQAPGGFDGAISKWLYEQSKHESLVATHRFC